MVPRRYPTSFGGGPKKKGQAIGTSSAAYPTQCGVQSTRAGRGELYVDQSLGAYAGNELAGQSGMFCQQKGAREWNLADATSNPAMSQLGSS